MHNYWDTCGSPVIKCLCFFVIFFYWDTCGSPVIICLCFFVVFFFFFFFFLRHKMEKLRTYNVSSNPPTLQKITLACVACLCFETGVCPWLDLSLLFQNTSPTSLVSLHLIPRIQHHPGIPVTLLTGSSKFSTTTPSHSYCKGRDQTL